MSEAKEALAVIADPGFGMRDCNDPVLWFTAKTLDGDALIILDANRGCIAIKGFGVYDVKQLAGKACVVRVHEGSVSYLRPLEKSA